MVPAAGTCDAAVDTADWTVLDALATVFWTWLTSVCPGPGPGPGGGLDGEEDEVDDPITEVLGDPDAELGAALADPDLGVALDPEVGGDARERVRRTAARMTRLGSSFAARNRRRRFRS